MGAHAVSRVILAVIAAALVAAGCGVTRGDDSRDLLMIIPNAPGGGYDQTGRAAVQVMEDADITGGSFTVDNVIGAGGAGAMTALIGKAGNEHTMMTVGLGVVGSTYSFASEYRLLDATPLAQVMSEPEGVLVPGDSPYKTIADLVDAWKADPGSVTVGGGSSPGGPDHLFPMQLAAEVGIDPKDVNYVSYDGGGPLTSALLGKKIAVGFSGLGEFQGQIKDGDLRVLAVSGEERLPQKVFADIPTLTESGVDLVFINWRGILAPPEISDERRDQLIAYLQEMHDSAGWQKALETNGWTDDFKTGDRVHHVPRGAGRTGGRHTEGAGVDMSEQPATQSVDRAQYVLAAALALVGVYTVIDARGLNVGFGDPVGPRVFPYVVGGAMVVLAALLAVATARGDVAEGEEGEDIDLTTPPDWVTVGEAVRDPRPQPPARRPARLADHRRAAVRRLRLGAGQQDAAA